MKKEVSKKVLVTSERTENYYLYININDIQAYSDDILEMVIQQFIDNYVPTDAEVNVIKKDIKITFPSSSWTWYSKKENDWFVIYIAKLAYRVLFSDIDADLEHIKAEF